MVKKVALFVSLFLFIFNVAYATRITREEKACPLCGTKFNASVVWSSNNFGGTDHDLCPHAIGASPLSSYIWGCPYCNFCGYSEDFSKNYTGEEKNKILDWLKTNYPPTIEKPAQEEAKDNDDEYNYGRSHNQYRFDSLPSYTRYEIGAKLAELANKSNYAISRYYLRASWCVRAETVRIKNEKELKENLDLFRSIERPHPIIGEEGENIGKELNRIEMVTFTMADFFIKIAERIEKREFKDENEKLLCYCSLAFQLRASGENTKAEEFIKKAEQCKDSEKFSFLFEGLRESIKLEKTYQSKVVEYLSASLNDKLEEAQKLETILLLGEMNRRLEKYNEAKKYYSILLEKSDSLPEQYMATVRFAMGMMGAVDGEQQESFNKIEENRIHAYLKKLPRAIFYHDVVPYLQISERRDIIYPKLVEIINDAIKNGPDLSFVREKDGYKFLYDEETKQMVSLGGFDNSRDLYAENFALSYALEAMSDETEEAAKFQYGLFVKGLPDEAAETKLIYNLEKLTQYLPSEKFIERFNAADTPREIMRYADFLKLFGDKPSFEALFTKAQKLINEDGLKKLVNEKYPDNNRDLYYKLVECLAFFRGERTVQFLVNLCESIKKIHDQIIANNPDKKRDCYALYDLYAKAGEALEIMYFRHFGFSSSSRDLEPKELEKLTNSYQIVEEPLKRFKEWYIAHKDENYKKIICDGFKEYGYDVFPVSDPKKLLLLVHGFEDRFSAARIQCYKEFIRRTGLKSHMDAGLDFDTFGRDRRQSLINYYNKWLKENMSKLIYNEKEKKFIIKSK